MGSGRNTSGRTKKKRTAKSNKKAEIANKNPAITNIKAASVNKKPPIVIIDPEEPKEEKQRYSFPTVARCPKCGRTDTRRTSQYKDRQYRQCKGAVCRKRFSVPGKLI